MNELKKFTPLVARVFLALIFILAGVGKLTAGGAMDGYFATLGIPMPSISVYLVGLFEVVAGLAIAVGYKTRIAALLLAAFCVASAIMAHANFADQAQMTMFLKNFAIAGGLLLLWLHGAGGMAVEKD